MSTLRSRKRFAVLAMVLTAAASFVITAPAGGTVDSRLTPSGLSAVPWSAIGPSWMLATLEPHPNARSFVGYLELISPFGARYVLYRLPPNIFSISDWSGDGSRVLYLQSTPDYSTIVTTVDLQTGKTIGSFKLQGQSDVSATFTRPRGLAVLVDTQSGGLMRFNLNGSMEARLPSQFPEVGRWTNNWLESPDGTDVVLGSNHGLAVYENDGRFIAALPTAYGHYCQPVRWWSPTVILATCDQSTRREGLVSRLLEFSAGWSRPRPLTRLAVPPDLGDELAARLDGHVYVLATTGCGYGFLTELHGNVPTIVRIRGLEPLNTGIITTNEDSLILVSANACTGQTIIDSYTPATGSIMRLAGPPVSSGMVEGIHGFPDPMATVGPAYGW
jgi:hypothetical protein